MSCPSNVLLSQERNDQRVKGAYRYCISCPPLGVLKRKVNAIPIELISVIYALWVGTTPIDTPVYFRQ